jgi:hypothetical protein
MKCILVEMYCKFARNYGVGKKTSQKAQIHKDIFPYLFTCFFILTHPHVN